MTVENDYLVFANSSTNIETQTSYAAYAALAAGETADTIASSARFNKAMRQGTSIAAMIAAFAVQQSGLPMVDNGSIAGLLTAFTAAVQGRWIGTQRFAANGTYTANPLARFILVEAVGGGGGSGGTQACSNMQNAVSGGGQAGSFARAQFTSGFTGGIAVTLGLGGTGGGAGNNNGNQGGTTTFGSLISAPGGAGGTKGSAQTTASGAIIATGLAQTVVCTVTGASDIQINTIGAAAAPGASSLLIQAGAGGSSIYGNQPPGGTLKNDTQSNPAIAGAYPGCGATGGSNNTDTSNLAGAAGANGYVVVYEFG
jgi:hypothetical protein